MDETMGSPFWSWNEIIINWKTPSSPTPKKVRVEPFEWFESHPKSCYAQGLLKVKERWQKCVDMQGDYVEK